jgi:hypothetical protein|tara:strand:- start:391 stop:537 length:147 start_codon:yes stop_codon:yes gene_type:complete
MPGNKNLYNLMNCSDKDFVDFIDVSTPFTQLDLTYYSFFRNASNGNQK